MALSPILGAANSPSGSPAASSPAPQFDYVLQPQDRLKVEVFQEPDLGREVRISQEYSITLPLIETINVKGKTIRQVQELIRERYASDYLVNPQINVTVLEYAKLAVNVLGAVNSPGAVPLPPEQPLNLLDAITRAGGFSRLADRKHVKLTRVTGDGKSTTYEINADEIIQSTAQDSWVLKRDDVIYVPERIL